MSQPVLQRIFWNWYSWLFLITCIWPHIRVEETELQSFAGCFAILCKGRALFLRKNSSGSHSADNRSATEWKWEATFFSLLWPHVSELTLMTSYISIISNIYFFQLSFTKYPYLKIMEDLDNYRYIFQSFHGLIHTLDSNVLISVGDILKSA